MSLPPSPPSSLPLSPPPPSLFLERLVIFLMPYFLAITDDFALARSEIHETLASYGARTRSEMLCAVQIIAFSFSALDMLADSKAMEMSDSMRLRFRVCANSLNRASQQNQKILAKNLACDAPGTNEPSADPINDTPDAEVQQLLQSVQAKLDTTRNRLANPEPEPQAQTRHPKGSAMFNALADTLQPPRTARPVAGDGRSAA